ncbi:unnamed protein product [Calypogeia fissa]
MATEPVKNVGSKAELESAVKAGSAVFAHFWATWCEPSKHMDEVFAQLAVDNPHAVFVRVEAEEQPEITETYGVSTVPYFLFFKDGLVADKLEGANAPELANKVAKTAGPLPSSSASDIGPRSLGLSAGPVVIEAAQQSHQTNGTAKHSDEELVEKSNGNSKKEEATDLNSRLKELLHSKPVLLFMKGIPEEPRCGFSKKAVNALNETGVEYGSFNILSDDEVRQGLKTYSNWPTYPQLYVNGELLGGCDIILEMSQSGELKQTFADGGLLPKPSLDDRLKQLINSSETILFMKGTPEEPRCGFSRKVVNALQEEGVQFGSFNILSDDEVRQGLKTFSNWPTYPQLYHKGELLGGCDIIMEMKANGELKSSLAA